ncbi:MAG: hypothetical protein ACRCXD_08170 [Luteolibacter sp.]
MKLKTQTPPRAKGFALIVTLSLMILLTVIAVGLLSLSSISLRSSASGEANARAFSNARLAVLLAIGELQKEVGDDRRITADASILPRNSQPHLVGAWDSWSPEMVAQPDQGKPDYAGPKSAGFRSWLVSAPDPAALRARDWAESPVDPKSPKLFSLKKDGFDLSAATVPMPRGSLAWAVSQENTKAKINVAGPETDTAVNVALQVQRRPSVALSASLKQPTNDWNLRSGRVLSLGQIKLDTVLAPNSADIAAAGASFTTHSNGLLTDVVNGGLKTDLNLGFELSDLDFAKDSWTGTPNPFRSPNDAMGFSSPGSYKGQRALFKPLVDNPIVSTNTNYSPASVAHRFFAASVPTFDSLRSYYRIPYHLYGGSQPTVAERGADHVATNVPSASGGLFAPSNPFPSTANRASILSVRPVLNRMIYVLSISVKDGTPRVPQLILTPVISLWNPYNTALEIEGAVAYPWMDIPFNLVWGFKQATGNTGNNLVNMSMMMAKQFESQQHGRSVNPYFLCELTANGDGDTNVPIRFEPGEVRVFTPASSSFVPFSRTGSNKDRTIRLRAVNELNQLNLRGGFSIPMTGGVKTNGTPHGITYRLKSTDQISMQLKPAEPPPNEPEGYHYFVSLEDAARIKNNGDGTRGQAISEVQVLKLTTTDLPQSPFYTQDALTITPQPYAVIETSHRTARVSLNQPNADLIYTTNPRHASINHQLAAGTFTVAPHFQSTIRPIRDRGEAIETSFDGRRSFWGATYNSGDGREFLPFFEIPREPILALSSFQHADLGSSTFSSANQFANSWASPYLPLAKVANLSAAIKDVPIYDTPYLTNESLWDGFFFSGATPVMKPSSGGKPSNAWDSDIASVQTSLEDVVQEFVADPTAKPLANSRMRLNKGGLTDKELVKRLLDPAGCTRIAGHLMVDGAFNVNSTHVEAWTAQLSALRGEAFNVEAGSPPSSSRTGFPRFRHPVGETDDNWKGFRALSDSQVRTLAQNIVEEVRQRGPFLSLAEFVNRRVEDSALGRNGAIQAAIETDNLNNQAKQQPFSTAFYPRDAQDHIIADTGVGIPGFLTQADVLKSLSSVITCRSDTFTIRGYGEAKDAAGKVIARSWCEAVVQRLPEFVDATDAADVAIRSLAPINKTFGRRFEIVSFRRVPSSELL